MTKPKHTRTDEFNAKLARKELEAIWLDLTNQIHIEELVTERNGDEPESNPRLRALVARRREVEAELDAAPHKQRPGPQR